MIMIGGKGLLEDIGIKEVLGHVSGSSYTVKSKMVGTECHIFGSETCTPSGHRGLHRNDPDGPTRRSQCHETAVFWQEKPSLEQTYEVILG